MLLVSGEPHPGERTWRNLLKSDAAVDLVHFTILRPPEKQDGTPINQLSLIAFPTRELFSEKINEFDLIIFDRYEHRGILQLLYYDNIARYVNDHGGALLIAAGDDYAGPYSIYKTPLAPVLPAPPTGQSSKCRSRPRSRPTDRNIPSPRTCPAGTRRKWPMRRPNRPGANGTARPRCTPQRGRVVMSGAEDKPLLILDRKGKGRVALLTSDHAWLWARGYDGGGPHTDLLRRLSHWLMKEPDLEEERFIASAKGLKLTIERRSMEDKVGPVKILGPGGDTSNVTLDAVPVEPGVWRSAIDVKLPGLYKIETDGPDGELTAVANAGVEDPREMSEVTATDQKMKPIADATGGGVFWTKPQACSSSATDIDVPRISMMSAAKVMAGSGWLGLKDRQAF